MYILTYSMLEKTESWRAFSKVCILDLGLSLHPWYPITMREVREGVEEVGGEKRTKSRSSTKGKREEGEKRKVTVGEEEED